MIRFQKLGALSLAALLSASTAFAAGFEKSQTWSASAASQASAVVGSVSGADALYFNPAGLASTSGTGDVSLNFSPTFSKFSGTNPLQTVSMDGKSGFSPVGALLASYRVTPQMVIGLGYYVSGGTKAKFEDINYTAGNSIVGAGVPGTAFTTEANLALTEAALGLGYEVMPGLRVGAAYRLLMVNADLQTVKFATTPTNLYAQVGVKDISQTRPGFKFGAQYESQDKSWGVGADYRSQVSFNAEGDYTQTAYAAGTGSNLGTTTGKAHVANTFPWQLAVGGFMQTGENLRTSLEYSYTNYNVDKELVITGPTATSAITQNWKNMHIARIGFDYSGMAMPIRFGYAYTSAVTPNDYPRSTFASPGTGHAVVIGSGLNFGAIDFDYALEYSWASGTGRNVQEAATTDSEFKSHAYVAHLSGKYHF